MSELVERMRDRIKNIDWFDRHERWIEPEDVTAALGLIEGLEIRCADKDANIAQLIEQLEKAEAQNATFRCAVCDDAFDDRQSFDDHRESAGHNYRLPNRTFREGDVKE